MRRLKSWQANIVYIVIPVGLLLSVPTANASGDACQSTTSGTCTTPPNPIPTSFNEFLKLRDNVATTPWGGLSIWLHGLLVQKDNRKLGLKMLMVGTSFSRLIDGKRYKKKDFTSSDLRTFESFNRQPYCANNYVVGATPDNGYSIDPGSVQFELKYTPKDITEAKAKIFVCSEGTPSCRPVHLTKNSRGIWKVENFSSLMMGCMKPSQPTPDDDL